MRHVTVTVWSSSETGCAQAACAERSPCGIEALGFGSYSFVNFLNSNIFNYNNKGDYFVTAREKTFTF